MSRRAEQVLTVAQMRAAEAALIAQGTSVDELMQRAGRGAAEWVWRIGGGRAVTVLAGPGNNGGDGWVIAEAIRERGGDVAVIAAAQPATPAALNARSLYRGEVLAPDAARHGEVLVDCLFGSGLTRPLGPDHLNLLARLCASHHSRVAVDLPSGIDADIGQPLSRDLPSFNLTLALGAWKPAHFLMPGCATMGQLKLVDIGIAHQPAAAELIAQPSFHAPGADAHKYTRGLLGVVVGAMPGAALLAARAAQGAGAGYVKLLAADPLAGPADLVVDRTPLAEALSDGRLAALLVGPGLGRDGEARERLAIALSEPIPAVLDADALVLLGPRLLAERSAALIATPHEGELLALERAFALDGIGSKADRAAALARASGMVIVAKGADTVVADSQGRLAFAPRGSSWLSTAGTGDVLAGAMASRLASGAGPFDAACEALWLHAEAARQCGVLLTASELAEAVRAAFTTCISPVNHSC